MERRPPGRMGVGRNFGHERPLVGSAADFLRHVLLDAGRADEAVPVLRGNYETALPAGRADIATMRVLIERARR